MLTIEKTVLPSAEQWEIIIEGMRNPKNSWNRMDSDYRPILCKRCDNCVSYQLKRWDDCEECETKLLTEANDGFMIGPNDHKLMDTLNEGGPVHAKYRRMIPVYVTINAPLYWWKEFDTYKVGTVCNSCSTMHKIHAKEFTLDDFSTEHLDKACLDQLKQTIAVLNEQRHYFVNGFYSDEYVIPKGHKNCWWQMIQLLPTSYNQKRTIMLNYEVLVGIYKWRRNHKLDEWHIFCDWIEQLPYSELITGGMRDEA